MRPELKHKELYLLVLVLGALICGTALGGGLFGQTGAWFQQWQHKAFTGLCHQDPGRSFWIGGSPMAVCTRCFGIYSGFTVLWALFPLKKGWIYIMSIYGKKILTGVVLLNIIDVAGNSLDFWQNTLSSRFLMGGFIGISAVFILGGGFIEVQQKSKREKPWNKQNKLLTHSQTTGHR